MTHEIILYRNGRRTCSCGCVFTTGGFVVRTCAPETGHLRCYPLNDHHTHRFDSTGTCACGEEAFIQSDDGLPFA